MDREWWVVAPGASATNATGVVGDRHHGRPRLQLRLLHGFQVLADARAVVLPLGAQRLVAFLAVHERRVPRLHVAGQLWPETSERHAHGNLRSTLWRLRKLVPNLVVATGDHLWLSSDVSVDVRVVMSKAQKVLTDDDVVDLTLSEECFAGELLPGWYDEWVLVEGEAVRQARLHALEKVSERLAARGRYHEAIEVGLTVVAAEPLRETGHRAVVRAHVAEGNLCEARRQYELCRRLLRDHLGVEPSSAMSALLAAQDGGRRLALLHGAP